MLSFLNVASQFSQHYIENIIIIPMCIIGLKVLVKNSNLIFSRQIWTIAFIHQFKKNVSILEKTRTPLLQSVMC